MHQHLFSSSSNVRQNTVSSQFLCLPISGANIVLGIQPLRTLGPTLTNYATITMQFD